MDEQLNLEKQRELQIKKQEQLAEQPLSILESAEKVQETDSKEYGERIGKLKEGMQAVTYVFLREWDKDLGTFAYGTENGGPGGFL